MYAYLILTQLSLKYVVDMIIADNCLESKQYFSFIIIKETQVPIRQFDPLINTVNGEFKPHHTNVF